MKNLLIFLLMIGLVSCQTGKNGNGETEGNESDTTAMTENDSEGEETLLSPPDSASITVGDLTVKITFGSPSVRGREVWGDLVPYGKVWRTGANEASTIEVSQDVTIEGKALPAGRYGFFTIPGENEWTVILNRVWEQWGAYEYNDKEDILRFTVQPQVVTEAKERMDFDLEETDGAAKVVFRWEKLMFSFMIRPA